MLPGDDDRRREEITVNLGRTLRSVRFLPLAVAALAFALVAPSADAAQGAAQIGTGVDAPQLVHDGQPAAAMTVTDMVGGEVAAVTSLPQAGAGTAVTVALPGEVALFALLAGALILVGLAVARHRPTV